MKYLTVDFTSISTEDQLQASTLVLPVNFPVAEQWQCSIPTGPHRSELDALSKSPAATCTCCHKSPHRPRDQRELVMVRNELVVILHAKRELQRLLK